MLDLFLKYIVVAVFGFYDVYLPMCKDNNDHAIFSWICFAQIC